MDEKHGLRKIVVFLVASALCTLPALTAGMLSALNCSAMRNAFIAVFGP
jgi:hypothetical protein